MVEISRDARPADISCCRYQAVGRARHATEEAAMHPNVYYAKARMADLQREAQRGTLANAAARARKPESGRRQATARTTFARRVIAILSARTAA